jgi:alpha-L-arabinofuranosidase
MKKLGVDLVDEHFYRPEKWFLSQGARYDSYDRKGPKVFAGEYACHGDGKKWNHFNASLLEAAFMTGLERNADVVHMATYAPLFAHVEGWQWRPDLIWYDNLRSVRSCSWYVQQLYSQNKGTHVASLTLNGKPVSGQEGQDGLFASAVWDADAGEYIVKIVNTSTYSRNVSINVKGLKKGQRLTAAGCTSFHSPYPDLDNTLENPEAIVPETGTFDLKDGLFDEKISAKTFMIYRLKKD